MSLADEIKQDPLGLGYAAHLPGDPQRVVDLMNEPVFSMPTTISAGQALMWAATGPMATITDASNNLNSPARASCMAFLLAMNAGRDVYIGAANVRGLLDAWVRDEIITQQAHDDLIALATKPASRTEVLGLLAPTARDVVEAWSNA